MFLLGAGAVDGHHSGLSSTWGEIQSQTTIAAVASTFLKAHNASNTNIIVHDDNKGVEQKFTKKSFHKLKGLFPKYLNALKVLT